jgi:hypothetical protein
MLRKQKSSLTKEKLNKILCGHTSYERKLMKAEVMFQLLENIKYEEDNSLSVALTFSSYVEVKRIIDFVKKSEEF